MSIDAINKISAGLKLKLDNTSVSRTASVVSNDSAAARMQRRTGSTMSEDSQGHEIKKVDPKLKL